jgi:hypothetical protein
MFVIVMLNLKINIAKGLAKESKYSSGWSHLFLNSYSVKFRGHYIIKRKIRKNYWQFTVANDITSCTFMMYEHEG